MQLKCFDSKKLAVPHLLIYLEVVESFLGTNMRE